MRSRASDPAAHHRLWAATALLLSVLLALPAAACPDEELIGCGEGASAHAVVSEPLPVGVDVPCPGIRPGANITVTGVDGRNSGCTASFVFRGWRPDDDGDLQDEGLFITTAGHCFSLNDIPARTFAAGQGPAVRLYGADQSFGRAVYVVDEGSEDFALVHIDPDHEQDVVPSTCHFGGPTRLSGVVLPGTTVRHFGHGIVIGWFIQARTGVSNGYTAGGDTMRFIGAASGGDSGGPVITADGAAAGVQTALLGPVSTTHAQGTLIASTLHTAVQRAHDRTGLVLELQTAPLAN